MRGLIGRAIASVAGIATGSGLLIALRALTKGQAAALATWHTPIILVAVLLICLGVFGLVWEAVELWRWLRGRGRNTERVRAKSVPWRPLPRQPTGAVVTIEADPASLIAVGESKVISISPPVNSSRYEGTLPIRVEALGGLSGERVTSQTVWEDWVWTVNDLVLTNSGNEVMVVTPYLQVPTHWQQKSDAETSQNRLTPEEDRAIRVPANDVARVTLRFVLPLWPLSASAKANPMFGGQGLVTLNLHEVGGSRTGSLEFDVAGLANLPTPRMQPPGKPSGHPESGTATTPPSGVTCLLPLSAEKSAYYVGSWVNHERLALLVITNTGPKEAEFRVELQQVQNTQVRVQISPGPLRWADGSESSKLSPGTFGVVQIGYLEKIGRLAQVLRLLGPQGGLTLEPSGVVGRAAISGPKAQAMAQVRMMGLRLRVTCDGVSEMFNLLIQFTGLDEALLQVIEWPDPE
jgi:hypothetical protein